MANIKTTFNRLCQKIPSRHLFRLYYRHYNENNFGVVITLHRITKTASEQSLFNNFIEISVPKLEETIRTYKRLEVKFVSLCELYKIIKLGRKPRRPVVHFSFDDGYIDNYTLAYPLFKKHKIPFSVFVTSDFISNKQPFTWWYILEALINRKQPILLEKYNQVITPDDYVAKRPDEIFKEVRTVILKYIYTDQRYFEERLLVLTGHDSIPGMMTWDHINQMLSSELFEVGIHSKTHPRFCNLSAEQMELEITYSRGEILANTGMISKYFAFPYGSFEDIGAVNETRAILDNSGIEMAFTTEAGMLNGKTDKYLVPRVFINDSATSYTLKSQLNGLYQRWAT